MTEHVFDHVTIRKTRKPHQCWGCLGTIGKNNAATKTSFVDMEKIKTDYWCPDCWEKYKKLDLDEVECLTPGDLKECGP